MKMYKCLLIFDKNVYIIKQVKMKKFTKRCSHGKRQYCRDCMNHSFCRHNRRREVCRNCSDNPSHLRTIQIVRTTKNQDILYNRYNENDHIDYEFVIKLFNNMICPYCNCKMTLILGDTVTLASIQRKNNSIGHTKDNCILACIRCNLKRMEYQIPLCPERLCLNKVDKYNQKCELHNI
jgi:hypothetical protein